MYEILADMSIDIDENTPAYNSIKYIPMEFMLGEETFVSEKPASLEFIHEYYEKLRNRVPTRTTQITPYNYVEHFRPYVEAGSPVLYLALSSGLSKTYESALLAVEQLKDEYGGGKVEIEVVDTLGATGGAGMLAEAAVAKRNAGASLQENAAWLRDHAKNIHYWFKVEDLMYLSRGGRISGVTAIAGTALNIKPVLIVDGAGKLETVAKKRGSRMAMKYMVERYASLRGHDDGTYPEGVRDLVYICCSDCLEDARALKEMVLSENPQATVRITGLCPVIGAHTGPDMIAVIYFGEKKE